MTEYILYYHSDNTNSQRAVSLCEKIRPRGRVEFRDIKTIPREQWPVWLNGVPILAILKQRRICRGGDCLRYLSQNISSKQETIPEHPAGGSPDERIHFSATKIDVSKRPNLLNEDITPRNIEEYMKLRESVGKSDGTEEDNYKAAQERYTKLFGKPTTS